MTQQRRIIYDVIRKSKRHMTAEQIYREARQILPSIAMGTVYRNLTLFKQQGLVSSIATVDGVERFDGNTIPHVHFICTDCNAVIDLDEMQVPGALRQAAAQCCGGRADACLRQGEQRGAAGSHEVRL